MKSIQILPWALLIFLMIGDVGSAQNNDNLFLWYDEPAGDEWVRALPVGNGRLGAMVYGNTERERIQLNENTVWAGSPHRNDSPAALEALPKVRQLIFEGKHAEAQELAGETFLSESHGMPYQPVGDLLLSFPGHENVQDYYRDLDLKTAVATTQYTVDDVEYTRKIFASAPEQVVVIQLTASRPGSITFSASMESPQQSESTTLRNELVLKGISGDHEGIPGRVRFQSITDFETRGGTISTTDTTVEVSNADTVTIRISIASNFKKYNDISGDEQKLARNYLNQAKNRSFNEIFESHKADYQTYFNRVDLDLGFTDAAKRPTDDRVADFASGNDPQLVELYFQYGRYLLISSSRPGTQPANLQGIWNKEMQPPWDSKYTLNINAEMNYWPADLTNLPEMHEPFIEMVRELSETGQETARVMYGADGWVTHHNTDIWRFTGPVDGVFWGLWPMGGAWLSHQLWEKYLYSGKKAYLQEVYPVLKGASEFYIDFLVEEPEHDWLVIVPSNSPENAPQSRPEASITAGATMDNQLVFDLFTNTIRAAEILGRDQAFASTLKEKRAKLPPMQIGRFGQLQEWMEDLDSPEDKHRHISHLFGLHPAAQISQYRTPELFDAARKSLEMRGDAGTGWSLAWKINFWARLLDGNRAYELVKDLLYLVQSNDTNYTGEGGTYPNLFCAHPPFQIDGNFGGTAGIVEMLMQSHDGAIHLLPALPDPWDSGTISGLRARGGFTIESLKWENGEVAEFKIKSTLGGNARIRTANELKGADGLKLQKVNGINSNAFYELAEIPEPVVSSEAELSSLKAADVYEYDFRTEAGKTYTLVRK